MARFEIYRGAKILKFPEIIICGWCKLEPATSHFVDCPPDDPRQNICRKCYQINFTGHGTGCANDENRQGGKTMRWVRPQVFMIAKTTVNDEQVANWLRSIGVGHEAVLEYAGSHVKTNAERLIELAGRRCYLSFVPGLNPNVTKIRTDIAEYLTNIMRVGHGSVLEHVTFTFPVENVSRVSTAEMNRHRAGVAISEGSMRYIRFNDIPIVEVPSLQLTGTENDYVKLKAREIIENTVREVEAKYGDLQLTFEEILNGRDFTGKKHVTSMLRRIIPMGVATGGIWTFNVRSLRHMLTMRAAAAAEEEICVVAEQMLAIMQKEEPILFGDFRRGADGHFAPEFVKV